MKVKLLAGLLAAGALPFVFSACKDDEPPKTGIAFEKTSEDVNESDGTTASFHPEIQSSSKGRDITVKLVLDRKLSDAVVLSYTLGGTALSEKTDDGELNDYTLKDGINTIVGSDKITIEKGATEATIKITLYEDFYLELDDDMNPFETIELTLQSIVSGPAKLPAPVTYTLTVHEDDLLVYLFWDDPNVDMDMVLWAEGAPASLAYFGSDAGAENPYEVMWIPGGYPDDDYGFSYNYYSGQSDDLGFTAVMYGNVGGDFYPYLGDNAVAFDGTYHLDNINEWDNDATGTDLVKVQDVSKTGVEFEPTDLTLPDVGSRSSGLTPLKNIKVSPALIQKLKSASMRIAPANFQDLKRK